jgi:hypothetical protein
MSDVTGGGAMSDVTGDVASDVTSGVTRYGVSASRAAAR